MAREIASVKIEEEVGGGGAIVIIIIASAAKDNGGGREAAVNEAGVDLWEACVARQLAKVRVRHNGSV